MYDTLYDYVYTLLPSRQLEGMLLTLLHEERRRSSFLEPQQQSTAMEYQRPQRMEHARAEDSLRKRARRDGSIVGYPRGEFTCFGDREIDAALVHMYRLCEAEALIPPQYEKASITSICVGLLLGLFSVVPAGDFSWNALSNSVNGGIHAPLPNGFDCSPLQVPVFASLRQRRPYESE